VTPSGNELAAFRLVSQCKDFEYRMDATVVSLLTRCVTDVLKWTLVLEASICPSY